MSTPSADEATKAVSKSVISYMDDWGSYETGSAGVTAAWSGLYSLLALRRQQAFRSKFSTRGAVRGVAIGLGAVNCASAAWVYLNGDFKADEERRLDRNRWGQYD